MSNNSTLHTQVDLFKAEIARLKANSDRWEAIVNSGSYSPGNPMLSSPIGFSGRQGQYTAEELNASVDAYIQRIKDRKAA